VKVVLFDLEHTGHHPQWVYYLARYLSEQGDEVTFVTGHADPAWDRVQSLGDRVRLHFLGSREEFKTGLSWTARMAKHRAGFRACLDLSESIRADVVHHLYLDRSVLPVYAARWSGLRATPLFGILLWPYFVRDSDENKSVPRRMFHALESRLLHRMLKSGRMDCLFVTSSGIRDSLHDSWGRDGRERIVPIPEPVDRLEPVSRPRARAELGLPADRTIIAFLGNVSAVRGADLFLRALPLVRGENWTAIMVGPLLDIPLSQVEACNRSLGSEGQLVTRFGQLPDSELALYHAASDVVVLPYPRFFKGASSVLQRAAATGRPVIAADVHHIGKTVRSEGLGILYEPESPEALAHAMESVLASPETLSATVLPRAVRYAEGHDWTIMARTIRNSYLTVLSEIQS
jgi:glycosyltransferase involved in cell wall biosynthesis